mgnify:FL=1
MDRALLELRRLVETERLREQSQEELVADAFREPEVALVLNLPARRKGSVLDTRPLALESLPGSSRPRAEIHDMASQERIPRFLAPIRNDAVVSPEIPGREAVDVELELGDERAPGAALEGLAVSRVATEEFVCA